jgi:hypothetical protein
VTELLLPMLSARFAAGVCPTAPWVDMAGGGTSEHQTVCPIRRSPHRLVRPVVPVLARPPPL